LRRGLPQHLTAVARPPADGEPEPLPERADDQDRLVALVEGFPDLRARRLGRMGLEPRVLTL